MTSTFLIAQLLCSLILPASGDDHSHTPNGHEDLASIFPTPTVTELNTQTTPPQINAPDQPQNQSPLTEIVERLMEFPHESWFRPRSVELEAKLEIAADEIQATLQEGDILPLIQMLRNLEINELSARYVVGFLHVQFMHALGNDHLTKPQALVIWMAFTDYYMRIPDPDTEIVRELFLIPGYSRRTQIRSGIPQPGAVMRTAESIWRLLLNEHMERDEIHPTNPKEFRPWLRRLLIEAGQRDDSIRDRIPNIDKWIEMLEDPETSLEVFLKLEGL